MKLYDTVIQMEEVLTIRVPKGTRRRIEQRAKAEKLTLSPAHSTCLDTEALLGALKSARADLVPIARAKGMYTDDTSQRRVVTSLVVLYTNPSWPLSCRKGSVARSSIAPSRCESSSRHCLCWTSSTGP